MRQTDENRESRSVIDGGGEHDPEARRGSEDRQRRPPDPRPDGGEVGQTRFVRFALYFYGAMIAAALIWRMGFHGESILYAGPEATARAIEPVGDAGIGIAVGLAVVAVSHGITRLTGWGDALARRLAEAIGPVSLPNALLLASASGIGEELFFRGALQPRVGLVAASLLFGAVHFVPRRELLPWTAFAIVVGLLFGILFEWTGNIVAPIVAHAVVNGINLPMLARRYGPSG